MVVHTIKLMVLQCYVCLGCIDGFNSVNLQRLPNMFSFTVFFLMCVLICFFLFLDNVVQQIPAVGNFHFAKSICFVIRYNEAISVGLLS